ncbi:GIY-YIG nuclease family protein [Candidatus Gottesmanbacteria bacterium]|nr:GIY-YIG nuclease family protein [Candidatus Gottesmanbacteria bacterium]
MKKLPFCIYVLLNLKDHQFYIGYTENLKQRLTDHFHGRSEATSPRRSFILIYCEYFYSKKDAYNREKYLKTSTGKRMLKLLLKESLFQLRASG